MFGEPCVTCDVYPSNIVDVQLNCTAIELMVYLTAGLVYSSPDGRITATTLINELQTILFSQDDISLLVNNTLVPLNQQCVPQLSEATQRACILQFTPETENTTSEITESTSSESITKETTESNTFINTETTYYATQGTETTYYATQGTETTYYRIEIKKSTTSATVLGGIFGGLVAGVVAIILLITISVSWYDCLKL